MKIFWIIVGVVALLIISVGIAYLQYIIENKIRRDYINSLPDDEKNNHCGTCGCKLKDEE